MTNVTAPTRVGNAPSDQSSIASEPSADGRPRSRYDAFISYSHAADGKLAPALQNTLQSFAKPWYRTRALRIFRDKTSLEATPELWPRIEDALSSSRYFILLASPRAAISRWVQQEVQWWLTNRSARTIMIVVTDGTLAWDERARRFQAQSSVLPKCLSTAFENEPLWLDLTWVRGAGQLSRKDLRFQDAVASLAAPLRNLRKEDLLGEDLRQHRRALRLAVGAASGLAIALALAILGGVVALVQRDAAITQAKLASARELAATARAWVPTDPELALRLAMESLERVPTDQGEEVLRQAVGDSRLLATRLPKDVSYLVDASFSTDGKKVLTGSGEDVWIWEAETGTQLARLSRDPGPAGGAGFRASTGRVASADFTPDGQRVLVTYTDNTARMWDGETGEVLHVFDGVERIYSGPVFSPDGNSMIWTSASPDDPRIWISDSRTYQPIVTLNGHEANVWTVDFSRDGKRVVTGGFDGTARVWDASSGTPVSVFREHADDLLSVQFSPDGKRVVSTGKDGMARVWEADTGTQLSAFNGAAFAVFSPDGTRVLTDSAKKDKAARIWDATTGKPILVLGGHPNYVNRGEFSPDGHRLVTVSEPDGSIRVWDAASGRQALQLQAFTGVTNAHFNRDGTRLLTEGNATASIHGCEFTCTLPELLAQVRPRVTRQLSPEERRQFLHES